MAAIASPSLLDRFRSWINFANDGAEQVDRFLETAQGATNIATEVMNRRGEDSSSSSKIRNGMADASSVVSATRITWALGSFFTGAAFIQTNADGSLKVEDGHYVWRSLPAIVLKISLLVGRALSLTNFMNTKQVYQIDPKTTTRINHATSAAFTLVSACGLYMAVEDAMQTPQDEDLTKQKLTREQFSRRSFMDVTRSGFDVITSIFDIAKNSSFGCAVASAVLHVCAGLSQLAHEWAWHQPE